MDEITVIPEAESEELEEASGVSRQLVFETDDTLMIQSRVAGGVTTDWHENGDRRVYGYIVKGYARLEYGVGGEDSVDLNAGDFVYVPPETIRRVVNPTDEDWVVVISFVGSGPPAITVDGPQAEDE